MKIFNKIKALFSSECSTPQCSEEGELISKKELHRSPIYIENYKKWLESNKKELFWEMLHQAFQQKNDCSKGKTKEVCFVDIPTLNGMTIRYNAEKWQAEDFEFYFEQLKDCLLLTGHYKLKEATIEDIEEKGNEEQVERYCFCPTDDKANYTSIMLRLSYVNKKVSAIKFCATYTPSKQPKFDAFLTKIQGLSL